MMPGRSHAAAMEARAGGEDETNVPATADRGRSFRPDVEGLRAIAVSLVVLYHARLPFLPGGYIGVDVFFVISGFLITGQLLSELNRDGRISISRFYARRAKRIVPAASLALLATAVLTWLFIPRFWWRAVSGDIASAALYVVNWRFAERSVDYQQAGAQTSPVLHFWSLAVEEQFYLVWPILILMSVLVGRVLRMSRPICLIIGVATIGLPSLVWSILYTYDTPQRAFFVTTTRMWELAVGAAIAIAARRLARLPRLVASLLAVAGLAAVGLAGVLATDSTPWPGYLAAAPTFGAAAVIAGGLASSTSWAYRLLSLWPLQWLGGLSYSVYLWHWPILAVAEAHFGHLSPNVAVVVGIASIFPAWIAHATLEDPLRHAAALARSAPLALSVGAAFTVLGLVAGLGLARVVPSAPPPQPTARGVGADVLAANPLNDPNGDVRNATSSFTPDPLDAAADRPYAQGIGCLQNLEDDHVNICGFGDENAATNIAIVGDSKVFQWLPALENLAVQNDWHLTTYTKGSCPLAQVPVARGGKVYASCVDWNTSALQLILAARPTYVITSQASREGYGEDGKLSAAALVDGMRKSWRALIEAGIKVIVIGDNPDPGFDVVQCVDKHRDDLSACTYRRDRLSTYSAYTVQKDAAHGIAGVAMVDLWDAICPTEQCSPVIGNVLVYRSIVHITGTYVRTVTPRLARALIAAGLPAHTGSKPVNERAWKLVRANN